MAIWDEIKAGAGIPTRTVDEVRNAVNRAVEEASKERNAVSLQAGGLRPDGQSLESSVAAMDVASKPQAQAREPEMPAQEMEFENAVEQPQADEFDVAF